MTEEQVVEKPAEETVVEFSPLEQEAMAEGWQPKEVWVAEGRNPDEWRPAKEFKDRGELFKTIHSLKREARQTKETLDALQRHHQMVFEKSYQKALNDLRLERRRALKDEDIGRVEEIEDKIVAVEQERETERVKLETATPRQQPIVPEFETWKSANSWYEADSELREYADVEGLVYLNKHPEMKANPEAVLRVITERVKKRFPEKFSTRKIAAPSPTGSVDKTNKGSKKSDDIELDETEREIMRTFVRTGVMTEEQYKAELKKVRG